MIICPDCSAKIESHLDWRCSKCGWLARNESGIVDMLSSADREDSFFRKYVDLYERIANSELSAPVNSDEYVKAMANRTSSLIGNIESKSVCDVGSGKGFLLRELLARKPSKLTAIDIAVNYLKKIELPGINRIVANAENLPFEKEFDVVVSTDVLEHVLNVGSFMFSINRVLKPNGIIVIRVPYREDLLQYSRQGGSPYPFTHLRTFNVDLLKHQLARAGLSPVKVVFDGCQPAYPRALFRSGIGKIIFRKLVSERYPDYWSVTKISARLGRALMVPIEVNIVCMKTKSLVK